MSSHSDLAYQIRGKRLGPGPFVPHAIAVCAGGCNLRLEFPTVGKTPPEHVAKHIRSKGWEFDLYNPSMTRCPGCIKKREERRRGDSGRKVVDLFTRKVEIPAELAPPEKKFPSIQPTVDSSIPPADTHISAIIQPDNPPVRRPIKDYRFVLRTDHALLDVARALSGLGEVLLAEVVEPLAKKASPGPKKKPGQKRAIKRQAKRMARRRANDR